ncbi:MAG: 3-deoxy-manno-octulosonate cytidylyltransferase [Puniceicoccaceae bacterium]|nr:MAG: 3-deoxy-manno-octulosonate cytidylyltransferase [Puniceicoccaceae bacterium]
MLGSPAPSRNQSKKDNMRQVIVIPARMASSRLPGKAMIDILGKPVIRHVWERCAQVHPEGDIFVATEDEVIVEYCVANEMNCVNTGPAECATTRVQLLSERVPAEAYLNIQGDEPLVNTQDVRRLLDYNRNNPGRIVFGKTGCSENDFRDPSKAKVVCAPDGRLLFTSRAGIPLDIRGNFVTAERAIWLFAFYKNALDRYVEHRRYSKLDRIEQLDIIRFLELDIPVHCIDMIGDSWAVDEAKDVKIVEERMKSAAKKG